MKPSRPSGSPEPVAATRTGRVQSVDRAMRLLRAVATSQGPDRTAPALAASCGLNRATAWRILSTLETEGFVACDRRTGRWSIGVGLVELAGASVVETLVRSAAEVLERVSLQTGETAALAVLRNGDLTYVDEVAPSSVVAATWRGRVVPLHATSTGKALLAFSTPAVRDRLLGPTRLRRFTDTTITDPSELDAELTLTRSRGYGTCRGEFEEEAYGVSAPVVAVDGSPLALLSIWGPRHRLSEDRFDALGQIALAAAASIAGWHQDR